MNESGFPAGWEAVGAPDCSNYIPTQHELAVLGAYWLGQRWFHDMRVCCGEPVDRRDSAAYRLAVERLDRLADELAPEVIADIRNCVEADYRAELGERAWRILRSGSAEEREKCLAELRDEVDSKIGSPSPAEVAEWAVEAWPGLAHAGLADVLRAAAAYVETHGVTNPLCGHDWQVNRQKTRLERSLSEVVVAYDRCAKCHGERHREIYPGDPGYEDAKRLADGPE